MSNIEGGGTPISPELKATYKNEFKRGMTLFEQSLEQYRIAEGGPKKEAFKRVMNEALQVMGETAKLCLNKSGQKAESKLESDYEGFLSDGSSGSLKKLQGDLKQIKENL